MSEESDSENQREKDSTPWGQVGIVLLTEYDQYGNLTKLGTQVQTVLDLFSTIGFDVMDANSLTSDGRASSLLNSIGRWQPTSNRLIIYWAGHGKAVEGGHLFLCSRDTAKNRQPEAHNSVPAGSLGDLLAGKDVNEIVLLLDVCGSGGGAEEVVEAFRAKANSRAYRGGFKPGLAVISSAGRYQFALEGAFSSALVNVLRHGPPADQSYLAWTERDEYITPVELFQAVRAKLARAPARIGNQIPEHDATGGVGRFFPNPRHRRLIPDVGVAEKHRRAVLLPNAVAEHFMLKFRGIDTVDDRGWFFTGREQLLKQLARWLGSEQSGLLVLTGPPGSGKSAILGRLAVLSVPEYRAKVKQAGALKNVRSDTLPPKRSIDAGVHAKNLSLTECISELADALQLPAPVAGWRSSADFVRQVASLRRPITLLFDALDEAQPADIHTMAVDLLRPLAELPQVKILVGTRPDRASNSDTAETPSLGNLLRALGASEPEIIRLDRDEETATDIAVYVRRRLLESVGSPYKDKPDAASAAATIITRRSDRVFLIARLLTHEFIRSDQIVDLDKRGTGNKAERRMIEGSLATAFTADLARYGKDERRIRALLAPLAFAEGAGLPSRDVWLAMAEALQPRSFPGEVSEGAVTLGAADLSWVVSNAGSYLIESGEDGQTVYRLYHQAFADYLRNTLQPEHKIQAQITEALMSQAEKDSKRHWNLANPYTLRHLATHAAAAGRLDELLNDSRYLLYAEPQKLRSVLAGIPHHDRPLTRLYWRCVETFSHATVTERAAVMQSVALRDEPEALPLLNTEPELPWRGIWSSGLHAVFHRTLPSHASPVTAVAFSSSSFDQYQKTALMATAAGDGVVRLWNPETGEQWSRFDSHSGTVFTMAFSAKTPRLLVTGAADGSIGCWDPEDGRLVRSFAAHNGPIFALALAETADGPLLATAGNDGRVRLWSLDTGQEWGTLLGHYTPVRALAFDTASNDPILVSGGDDGRVRMWDARRLSQLREFGGTGWIYAVALGRVGGRSVLATGSAFGTVRLWDLTTNRHLASFAGHQGAVGALAWGTLDGRPLLATGGDDGAIRLWEPHDGRLQQTLTRSAAPHLSESVSTPTRSVLALGSGQSAVDLDSSPEDVVAGTGRARSIQALAWRTISGNSVLASGDGDWVARLWEPAISAVAHQNRRVGLVRNLAVGHAYGYSLIAEGCRDNTVRLREAATGRELRVLDSHRKPITAIAFGLIDKRLITASADESGTILLHDAMTGHVMLKFNFRTRSTSVATTEVVIVADVAGRTVVMTDNGYGEIALWDARTGGKTRTVAWRKASRSLALGEVQGHQVLISGGRDGYVATIELASGRITPLPGHGKEVRAVAFGNVGDLRLAATASADSTVRVWDLTEAKECHALAGHIGPVNTVAFGHAGRQPILVSAGDDHTVRLWNPVSGESLGLLAEHARPVAAVVMFEDTDGKPLICTGAEDGTHLIRFSPSSL